VLDKISGDEQTKIDKEYLREQYLIYEETYKIIILKAADPKKIPEIIDRLVAELSKFQQPSNNL
jgi:hypothetical protein